MRLKGYRTGNDVSFSFHYAIRLFSEFFFFLFITNERFNPLLYCILDRYKTSEYSRKNSNSWSLKGGLLED